MNEGHNPMFSVLGHKAQEVLFDQ